MDLEKIDNCSETCLGLLATAGLTLVLWIFGMPLFHIGGMSWVQGWERLHPDPEGPPITLPDFRDRMYNAQGTRTPPDAFSKFDRDGDDELDFEEFNDGTVDFFPPLKPKQVRYAFDGFDHDKDFLITRQEFEETLDYDSFEDAAAAAKTSTSHEAKPPAVSTTKAPVSTTTKKVSGPLDMAAFKQRLGAGLINKPRDAFDQFDHNGDEYIDSAEFKAAAADIQHPIGLRDAEQVFASLDTSQDNRIESLEFYKAWQADKFLAEGYNAGGNLPPQLAPTMTVKEFASRLGADGLGPHSVKLSMDLAYINFKELVEQDIQELKAKLVQDISDLTDLPPQSISDPEGHPASVQVMEATEQVATQRRLRRLSEAHGLRVIAMVAVPAGEASEDIIAVLESVSTKTWVATSLHNLPSLQDALHGRSFEASDVSLSVSITPSPVFTAADFNGDSRLTQEEFGNAAEALERPLTKNQSASVFKALDTNLDGQLTPAEFAQARAVAPTTPAPPTTRPPTSAPTPAPTSAPVPVTVSSTAKASSDEDAAPMSMKAFKDILVTDFKNYEDAFGTCDSNHDGKLQKQEFQDCMRNTDSAPDGAAIDYAFGGLNTNHDSEMTHSEYLAVLATDKFYPSTEEMKAALQAAQDKLSTQSTSDDETPISMDEFKHRMEAFVAKEDGERKLEDATAAEFLRLDQNSNKKLELHEFLGDTQLFEPRLTDEQARFAFRGLDEDRDGAVTHTEFSEVLSSGHFAPAAARVARRSASSTAARHVETLSQLKNLISQAVGVAEGEDLTPDRAFFVLSGKKEGKVSGDAFIAGEADLGVQGGRAAEAFVLLDKDRDGQVSVDEFAAGLGFGTKERASSAPAGGDSPPAEPLKVAPARMAMPMDERVPITMSEFKALVATDTLQDLFMVLDSDADGALDEKDFGAAGEKAFMRPLTAEEAEYVFKGFDSKHDGHVTPTEFFGTSSIGHFYQTAEAVNKAAGQTDPDAPTMPQVDPKTEGPITVGEFRARLTVDSAEDAFSGMDEDEDGFVSAVEYYTHSDQFFNPPLISDEILYSLNGLDADEDSKISPVEYFGALKLGQFFQTPEALRQFAEADVPIEMPTPAPAPRTTEAPAPVPVPVHVMTTSKEPQHFTAPIIESEFVKKMRSSFLSPLDAFDSFDANGDGSLDFDEFVAGSRDFEEPLKDPEAMYSFKGFDANDDHTISKEEFFGTLRIGHFFQTEEAIHKAGAVPKPTTTTEPVPTTTTTGLRFDCQLNLDNFELEWSAEKKHFCCEKELKGCAGVANLTMAEFMERLGATAIPAAEAYQKVDVDHDNFLSFAELKGSASAFTPPLTEGEVAAAIKGLDANSDQAVALAEFVAAARRSAFYNEKHDVLDRLPKLKVWTATEEPMTLGNFQKRMQAKHASPKAAFESMDFDGDSWLTADDFVLGVAELPSPLSRQEALYAFQGFDVNTDGLVSAPEWEAVFKAGKFYQTEKALQALDITYVEPPNKPQVIASAPEEEESDPEDEPKVPQTVLKKAELPAGPSMTTTTVPPKTWEISHAPLSLTDFEQRMGSKIPEALRDLSSKNGGCVNLATFREAAKEFIPPLTNEEADYAFCGMDENHDKKVCSFEFFGTMKVGEFFPSRSHLEHLREVGALRERPGEGPHGVHHGSHVAKEPKKTVTPAPEFLNPIAFKVLTDEELEQYREVPAIVNGRAEINLHLRPGMAAPGESENKKVAELFEQAFEKELGISVNVADITSIRVDMRHHGAYHARTLELLFTAGTNSDGGALQATLFKESAKIESQFEELTKQAKFPWLDHTEMWARLTLNYYGQSALALPAGQRISQDIGHHLGQAAVENDADAARPYAGSRGD